MVRGLRTDSYMATYPGGVRTVSWTGPKVLRRPNLATHTVCHKLSVKRLRSDAVKLKSTFL